MILVTGGTGFLGSQLVQRLLDAGESVRVLCRKKPEKPPFDGSRVQWAVGDVTDAKSLEPAFQDVRRVYHVAGRVDFHPWRRGPLLETNEQGTRNVMTAAQRAGVERIVHVSSVSTIGATPDPTRPLTEEDFGKGLGLTIPYPQSKHRAECVALEFFSKGLPVVICNPTFFAGPGDLYLSSARTIVSFLRGQVWVGLTTGGMGYTDVRDIVSGLVAAMEKGAPGRRYILGGTNIRLREYHAILAKLTGIRAPRIRVPWPMAMPLAVVARAGYRCLGIETFVGIGDIRLAHHYWFYDYARSRTELGLHCRSPEESLRDALDWLHANKLAYA